jgi:cell division topological specificity factor
MNLLELFRKKSSAPVARERLQIILAHERAELGQSDLLVTLREEILQVIARHMPVERDKVHVSMDRGNDMSLLEVEVELPLKDANGEPIRLAAAAGGA